MRHRLRIALPAAAYAGIAAAVLAAPAAAQVPGATIKGMPPPALSLALKGPDLVVTMGPGSPFPSSFMVKNAGNADAGVSVLRVTATLLPLERIPSEPCPPMFSAFCETRNQAMAASFTPERLRSLCGDPFADVLDAIPPLRAGETKTITRDTSRFANIALRLTAALGPQPGTYIKPGVTTLVCAFDVVAQADASNQVHESREDNNSATQRVYREIRLE